MLSPWPVSPTRVDTCTQLAEARPNLTLELARCCLTTWQTPCMGWWGGGETELQMSPEQGRVRVREQLHDSLDHLVHYVGDLSSTGVNGVHLVAIITTGKS